MTDSSASAPGDAPYDPFAPENILIGLVDAVGRRAERALADLVPVKGAGVYLLYYMGVHQPFPVYEPLAQANGATPRVPIYVGKAVPKGARKGQRARAAEENEAASVATRLNNHRASIDSATNLDIRDFRYRYLPVKAFWIPTMERLLVEHYAPLWNQIVDGFGNKAQGSERATTAPSAWDTLHPGRLGNVDKRKRSKVSREHILAAVEQALAHPPTDLGAETATATEMSSGT